MKTRITFWVTLLWVTLLALALGAARLALAQGHEAGSLDGFEAFPASSNSWDPFLLVRRQECRWAPGAVHA